MSAELPLQEPVADCPRKAHGRALRSSALLTGSRLLVYSLSFTRNLILVRMLTKADFGLAAVFGMTIGLLEVAGRMAFGQQVVQNRAGDSDSFLATSHTFQLGAGLCGALLMGLLSVPLAHLFEVPHAWPYFALLGCVPFFKAFEHLDVFRQQREMKFLPSAIAEVTPQLIVTVAALPMTLWLKDYRVIVWLMAANAALSTVMTHLMAEHRYRCQWHPEHGKQMLLFSWPLLLNGLLMFACQEADQVLVAKSFSLGDLGMYALALSLVSIPWFIFAPVASSLMLPIFSKAQDHPERFRIAYGQAAAYAATASMFVLLPLIIAGEHITTLLYGAKYLGAGPIVALLAAASAIRFARFAPAVAAMAKADTMNQLYANLWRTISLPLAIGAVLLSGANVIAVAACALAGEIVAATASVVRLCRRQNIPIRDNLPAILYLATFLACGLFVSFYGLRNWGAWTTVAATTLLLLASQAASMLIFPNTWTLLWSAMGWRERNDLHAIPVGKPIE